MNTTKVLVRPRDNLLSTLGVPIFKFCHSKGRYFTPKTSFITEVTATINNIISAAVSETHCSSLKKIQEYVKLRLDMYIHREAKRYLDKKRWIPVLETDTQALRDFILAHHNLKVENEQVLTYFAAVIQTSTKILVKWSIWYDKRLNLKCEPPTYTLTQEHFDQVIGEDAEGTFDNFTNW